MLVKLFDYLLAASGRAVAVAAAATGGAVAVAAGSGGAPAAARGAGSADFTPVFFLGELKIKPGPLIIINNASNANKNLNT